MNNTILPIGTVLNHKYRIVRHLASGGFGNTYLAEYGSLKNKVALKEFFMKTANKREADNISVSIDPTKENSNAFHSQLNKFIKEAERLKQINNVHVVKVHDIFQGNGTAYYTMDFVEGNDMEKMLANRKGSPYAESTVLNYLNQILDGLAAIHAVGVLHLDIKPSNIMKSTLGHLKLIDLGSSKDFTAKDGATVYTAVTHTQGYAPPEQAAGNYEKFGPWTDFYALGATLYRLLTCREIPTYLDILDDKTRDKHESLPMPGVSDKTRRLIVSMMSVERSQRPQNVKDIQKLLRSKAKASPKNSVASSKLTENEETTIIPAQTQHINKLEIPKSLLYFDASSCSKLVYIDTNDEWDASCTDSWIHLYKGGCTITIHIDQNTSDMRRCSKVFVKSGNLSKTIVVNQSGIKYSQIRNNPRFSSQVRNNQKTSSQVRNNPKNPSQEEPEFSVLGFIYLIIIIAIAIYIVYKITSSF